MRTAFFAAGMLLAGTASATWPRSCARHCSDEIALRCGSDGITYANECLFRVAQCENTTLQEVAAGVCGQREATAMLQDNERCEKGCTREYMPVCGSNGVTYPNKCVFRNAQRCQYGGKLWIVARVASFMPPIVNSDQQQAAVVATADGDDELWCEPRVVSLLLPPPISFRIVLTSPAFTLCWWFVVMLHAVIAVFSTLQALVHLTLSIPVVHLNTVGVAVSIEFKRLVGLSYLVAAVVHLHAVVKILLASLRRRTLCWRLDDDTETSRSPAKQSSDADGVQISPVRRVFRRVASALCGPTGWFSIHSTWFPYVLIAREAVEVLLQTYQVWTLSYFVTSVRINSFAVGFLALNCWSIPLVDTVATHEGQRRLLHLVADLSLDFACSVGIPIVIVLRYLLLFDWTTGQFPEQLVRNEVWFANAISEGKQVMVTTSVDFVSSLLPLYSTFQSTRTLTRLVRRAPSTGSTTAVVPFAVTVREISKELKKIEPSTGIRTLPSRRFFHVVSTAIALWGVVLLGLHIHANVHTDLNQNPGCKLYARTWLATNATCMVQHIDCTQSGIDGHEHEVASILNGLERSVLTKLTFEHCRSLAIPPQLAQFRELNRIELLNSSLVGWAKQAAVRAATHPVLTGIMFRQVNLSTMGIPAALLHRELPHLMLYVAFFNCSLTALPEHLGQLWATRGPVQLLLDGNRLRTLPVSLGLVRFQWLWVTANQLHDLPDELFERADLYSLKVSGNPLVRLPTAIKTTHLRTLMAEHTNVERLPAWAQTWLATRPPTAAARGLVSFFGSPVCNSTSTGTRSITSSEEKSSAITAACGHDWQSQYGPVSTIKETKSL